MSLAKNQSIKLEITALSNDGNGIGRYDGQAVFVPGAAPGDILNVKIVKAAKSYAFGRLESVLQASHNRIVPDCPIATQCGGCDLRHITYEAELQAKQGFVTEALRRIGGLSVPVSPILASPLINGYRNKMQLPLTPGNNGKIEAGFYAKRSHRVVPYAHCLLQPPILNEIAAFAVHVLEGAHVPAYNEATRKGVVRHLYLRRGYYSGEILLCLVVTCPFSQQADFAQRLAQKFPAIKTVVLNINNAQTNVILGSQTEILLGPGYIHDTLSGVPLQLDVHSFAQVNTLSCENLFTKAREYAAVQPHETLLDLYCGAGVIGLSMAKECAALVGVEVVPQAIENAKAAAQVMGLAHKTRFLAADAGQAATCLAKEGLQPDVITVDPPRKGCDEATLQAILQMAPNRIVMVSCNPATMARDLKYLSTNGYIVQQVTPADFFPRTKHVECVVLMSKVEK